MSKRKSDTEEKFLEKKKVPSFGLYLKTEREKKGLSLEGLYKVTKIQVRFLEALEADHFEALPVYVLIRGYIRTIADILELSPEETVKRYDDYLKQLEDVDRRVEEEKKSNMQPLEIPLERNFTIALAATIIIGIVFTVIYFIFPDAPVDTEVRHEPTVMEEPAPVPTKEDVPAPVVVHREKAIPAPAVEAEIEPQQPETSLESQLVAPLNREDGINYVLEFYILDESWIKVKVDDEEPRNFMLRNNTPATFYAKKQLLVDIGRVSSTELIVNGINIEIPQPVSNVIKEFTINDETVKSFVKRENLLDRSKAIPREIMEQRALERLEKERLEKQAEAEALNEGENPDETVSQGTEEPATGEGN